MPFITHSKWREDAPWLLELQREPTVDINPEDAASRGLKLGDAVLIRSAWGEIRVRAKPTIMMPPGVVGMFHGWVGANVNDLVPREFDPISGFPPFKETPCEVTKVGES